MTLNAKHIILLNEDNLRANHPVFDTAKAQGNYETVFIFDTDYLHEQQYSFKRIVFIYECLQGLNCHIFKGKTLDFITKINPETIFIPQSIAPHFKELCKQLSKHYTLEIITENTFVALENPPDLNRFFRYWNKAKKQLFKNIK